MGQVRLERALQAVRSRFDSIQVEWRPFLLNPDMERSGTDRTAYITKKFGPPDGRWAQMERRLVEAGRQCGFEFKFGSRISWTVGSHALLEHVKATDGLEAQNRLARSIFNEYFVMGNDIGEEDVLLRALQAAGGISLSADSARHIINDPQNWQAVARMDREAKTKFRVSGVPAFILQNKFMVSGAQDESVLVEAFNDIAEEMDE